jgi:hypothetical protein
MVKVLYLIASHQHPEQLVRLVRALHPDGSNSQVVIHHDRAQSPLDPSLFTDFTNVHILEKTIAVQWGEFSMVEMELHCIDWIIQHQLEFDWLVFLSGQDYPIQPIGQIEHFLETTQYDGFMEYFLAEKPPENPAPNGLQWQSKTGIQRFFYHYHHLTSIRICKSILFRISRWVNGNQPWFNLVVDRNAAKLGIRYQNPPFHDTFQCYAGSQWYILSRACIQAIHGFVKYHPEVIDYYRKTIIPDESLIQTIVLNHPQFQILNDNKRYLVWNSQSKPDVLKAKDFEQLIASKHFFARKFDQISDRRILDLLDQHLSRPTLSHSNTASPGSPGS